MYKKILFLLIISFVYINAIEFENSSEYITTLDTKRDGKEFGNVIQGLANYKDYWITSQTSNNNYIILNFFKDYKSIYNIKVPYPSHGQDLSSIYDENKKELYLYTSTKDWNGFIEITFDLSENTPKLIKVEEYNLDCKFCTPTVSKDGKYIALKDNGKVFIYSSKEVFNMKDEKPKALFSFNLDKEQTKKGISFQGIEMKDDIIYTLSGNADLDSDKWLVVYDIKGNIIHKTEITAGKEEALKEGNKYEPEGLEIKDNYLYTTFMSGEIGKNIKRLYKILEVK